MNHGTLYPVLLRLKQEGAITRNGTYRRIIVAPSSTRSPSAARNNSPQTWSIGPSRPKSSSLR
ncbi:MAG TPA: hypothetical protein VH601_04880 [Bryobacteraceae bacterium]